MRLEAGGVVENGFLVVTESFGNGVEGGQSWDVAVAVLDDDTVLNVDTTNFAEGAGGSVVARQELGDDGEYGVSIDGQARSVEGLVTHTEGVEVAAVGVAQTVVSVSDRALFTSAFGLTLNATWVGGECRRDGVGFPNIHLVAT